MISVVKGCQTGISNPRRRLGRTVKIVVRHHVYEDPRHAEVQFFGLEQGLERLTGTTDTERSSRRLNRQDARVGGLVVEPLTYGLQTANKLFNADHAASFVAQARQATAHARAAIIASLQQDSLGHLAE
jgi:hypothetical protein